MPTVIIKSGATEFSGATVKGNFSYFVDPSIDLGPSNVTGFYSGYEPPVGGYTIYKTANVDGGMTVRTAVDSSSLNSVLIDYGAPYATLSDNVAWADANNDILIYSGGTPSYYTWANYYYFGDPCDPAGLPQITVYTSGTPLAVDTQLYTDTSLTTPWSPGANTQFGAGGFGSQKYSVTPSGIIQIVLAFRCGISQGTFGYSNSSQTDAASTNNNVQVWFTGTTVNNGDKLYTDDLCTIPYTASTYVGGGDFNNNNTAYGWNVNQSTGVLSNKTVVGYYFQGYINNCLGTANCSLVEFGFILSPDNSLNVFNYYYDGVTNQSIQALSPQNGYAGYFMHQLHSGYTGPDASCNCP
jgi:hypothetical protein